MNSQTLRRCLITAGLSVLAAALMLVLSVSWNSPVRADDDDDDDYYYKANQVVVKLNPSANTTIDRINSSYGTRTLQRLLGSANIYLLELPPRSDEKEMANKMEKDWRLLYAEPNFIAELPEAVARHRALGESSPALASEQYAVDALNLPCAHGIARGRGSVVAVLDTGVQLDHPDLRESFEGVKRYDFVDDDADPSDERRGLDEDGNGYTDEMVGHGTHVAGIVGLVAPEAKIMPLRVLSSDGYGYSFAIAEAIAYAERNGANVINLSLSTPEQSGLLANAISKASKKGTVVVAAAGNSGNMVRQYPAANSSALGVTSVDEESEKSTFASYGYWVDVAAPGDEIYSALPTNDHAWWSGTSMAAPFVAGQAALIHSVNPSLSVGTIQDLIAETARSLDAQNPTYRNRLGDGQVDIGGSLGELSPGPECDGAAGDSAGGDDDDDD
jgi:subtilisin family serine protease